MDEFRADIKEIKSDISEIKRDTAINTVSLLEHIKRTELAEKRLDRVENWLLGFLASVLIAGLTAALRSLS